MTVRKTIATLRGIDREIAAREQQTLRHTRLTAEEKVAEMARLLQQAAAIAVAVRVLKQLEA